MSLLHKFQLSIILSVKHVAGNYLRLLKFLLTKNMQEMWFWMINCSFMASLYSQGELGTFEKSTVRAKRP